jgi:predicted transcriptional regulator
MRQVPSLSKRERQIMDVVYRLGRLTAAEIHAELSDAPTLTTVRGLLRILVAKQHLKHVDVEGRFVYFARTPRDTAAASHLGHVVRTFFDGSPSRAVAAMLGPNGAAPTDDELARMEQLIADARKKRK